MEEFPQTEQQKFTLNSAIWVAIKSQIIGFGIMIIPLMILFVIFNKNGDTELSEIPFYNTIVLLSVALGEYIVIKRTMKTLNLVGFPIRKTTVLISFLLVGFTIFGGILIGEFSSIFNLPNIVKWHEMSKFDIIVGGIILAPIMEELLFRGLILEGLLRTYSPEKAIVFSSIIFGVIHFNPAQILSATLMGIFLGWLYYRSKSLAPSIIVHFANNFLAFFPMFFTDFDKEAWEKITIYSWLGNVWLYILLILVSSIIVFFVLKTLNEKWKNSLTAK